MYCSDANAHMGREKYCCISSLRQMAGYRHRRLIAFKYMMRLPYIEHESKQMTLKKPTHSHSHPPQTWHWDTDSVSPSSPAIYVLVSENSGTSSHHSAAQHQNFQYT